jgi:hypothetical protein
VAAGWTPPPLYRCGAAPELTPPPLSSSHLLQRDAAEHAAGGAAHPGGPRATAGRPAGSHSAAAEACSGAAGPDM